MEIKLVQLFPELYIGYYWKTSLQKEILETKFSEKRIQLCGYISDVTSEGIYLDLKGQFIEIGYHNYEEYFKDLISIKIFASTPSYNCFELEKIKKGECYSIDGIINRIRILSKTNPYFFYVEFNIKLLAINPLGNIWINSYKDLGISTYYKSIEGKFLEP